MDFLRLRRISLHLKIMILLVFALLVSLGASSWLVYRDMKSYVYQTLANSLMRVANMGAISLSADTQGLSARPMNKKAGQNAWKILNQVSKRTYIEGHERLDSLSLFQMDSSYHKWSRILDVDNRAKEPGSGAPPAAAVEAAIKGHATFTQFKRNGQTFLSAFACLNSPASKRPLILCLEYDASHTQEGLHDKLRDILLAALVGLALTIGGVSIATHQWTKPLRGFVQVMRLMQTTANYNLKIDLHPEDKEMTVVEQSFQRLIDSVRLSREQLEISYMATLKALVAALDIRDNDTAGHSLRVQRYALLIAHAMRVSDKQRLQVERGSLLHDIGKIGIPDAILHKKDSLDPGEWAQMKKHPTIGRNLVQGIEFLEAASDVILCHHERWDGSGYPQGLKGLDIPLAARIFAVADAFDTMTAGRVYRSERSFEEARTEIRQCGGYHFDPAVVQAFLMIPESAFLRVRRETHKETMPGPHAKQLVS